MTNSGQLRLLAGTLILTLLSACGGGESPGADPMMTATGQQSATVAQAIQFGRVGELAAADSASCPALVDKLGSRVLNDFDCDGTSDILWRDSNTGEVVIWSMNPDGTRKRSDSAGAVPADWTIQGIGDFNKDGRPDLLWRSTTTGQVVIWFMNGPTRTGSSSALSAVSAEWSIEGVGDFDHDGVADILWRNTTTGAVVIYFMNSDGTLARSTAVANSPIRRAVQGIGDFNHDGKADVVWRDTATGQVYIWLMDGATRKEIASNIVPIDWVIQGIGDFNGDGISDILWRNAITGQVVIWKMSADQIPTGGSPDTVADSDWVICAVGDFDSDGKADILWQNRKTGGLIIWNMDGAGRKNLPRPSPGVVPTDWQIVSASPSFAPVPALASLVTVKAGDNRLYVRRAISNSVRAPEQAFVIRGVAWEPANPGDDPKNNPTVFHERYLGAYRTDIPLMAAAGINVVRVYHDFGTGTDVMAMLDAFYRAGIWLIVEVGSPRAGVTGLTSNIKIAG